MSKPKETGNKPLPIKPRTGPNSQWILLFDLPLLHMHTDHHSKLPLHPMKHQSEPELRKYHKWGEKMLNAWESAINYQRAVQTFSWPKFCYKLLSKQFPVVKAPSNHYSESA